MVFVLVHHPGTAYQTAGALSRLPITKEDGTLTDVAFRVMSVVSQPIEDEKVCIKTTDVIHDNNDIGFIFISRIIRRVLHYDGYTRDKHNSTHTTIAASPVRQCNVLPARCRFCRSARLKSLLWPPWVVILHFLGCVSEHIMMPNFLYPRLFHLSHYPKLSGHLSKRCMYDTTTQELYWPHVAN